MHDIWEPWTPGIWQRVRVRVSAECPIHGANDYPLDVNGRIGWVRADVRTARNMVILDRAMHDQAVSLAHHWYVDFFEKVGRWDGRDIGGDDFAAAELEPAP